ncbi:MAG TPA: hypothetical protein VK590_01815 [Saprospiraceae bacterium]|nr:hypothetical protein [Saprospiraceae bacterium]
MNTINFKSRSNTGDIIYSLSGIKSVCEKRGVKANLYLWLDRIASYYPGSTHPVKDITGKKEVSMNHFMFKWLKPLLESQEYINSVDIWNGETIHIDLDKKLDLKINQPYGDLRKWDGFVFPDMNCDISIPALSLPGHKVQLEGVKDNKYIVVNRTERYNNTHISYFFLKEYPVVIFVGTPKEYNIFKKEVPHAVFLQPPDFLELAQLIKGAQLMIGNQSMCFAIAEQLKTPRVLEVCSAFPNVIVAGTNGYDFYFQSALEYYVAKLWRGEAP